MKLIHFKCILLGLVCIHCGTTLPPLRNLYINLPTEEFRMHKLMSEGHMKNAWKFLLHLNEERRGVYD